MELNDLIKKHLKNVIKENEMTENYMFFGNLQQIQRQCEMLLKMNPQELDNIIKNGHDWADDHVSEAKNNMDQVFDFFMNETKRKDGENITAKIDTFSVNEAKNPSQQAAIAINMKKQGKSPKNESEKEMYESMEIDESKNCPTDPAKWAASKAAAKRKFDVYPSAYANGWAAKNYKSKGGGWKKCK
jgi:hypothetical protein